MIFIITLISMVLIGLTFIRFAKDDTDFSIGFTLCVSVLIVIIAFFISKHNEPTAIEVYQGKTTLKITYEDDVPVDSVVIYKNK